MQRPANIDTLDHVLLKDVSADNDDHNSSAKSSSLDGEPGDHVIIKSGKFVNCLARISSKGTSNNRYNLQILTDDGVPLRRHDNALKCTALVRSGFDVLGVPSHQDAEGQSIVDIVAVTAELKKRRLELNLPDFTPSIAAKRSNASISASGMVGSPMSKSKLKIKGNTQDETDGNSAEGDGGESRNNLYWADCSPYSTDGSLVGYACVWYGGYGVNPMDSIFVLPIAPPVRSSSSTGAASADLRTAFEVSSESSATASATAATADALGDAHISISSAPMLSSGTKEGTGTASGSDSGSTADEFPPLLNVSQKKLHRLRRSDLQPLDDVLVNAKYAELGEDNVHRQFLLALLEFAEWDYPQRDSYIWPDFIVELMQSPPLQMQYLETARKHPLNNGARSLYDVILFLLCAEHSGILDEWDDDSFLREAACSDTLCSLLENLVDFKRTGQEIFRSVCRVADCFQVLVPTFSGGAAGARAGAADTARKEAETGVIDLTHSQTETESEESAEGPDTGEPAVYSLRAAAQGRDDAEIVRYLDEVQRLRARHIRVNQLIEAPLDLDAFLKEWNEYNAAVEKSGGSVGASNGTLAGPVVSSPSPSSHILRTQKEILDRFIAHSRRQSKKLTALCTVKYIMGDHRPSGSSFSTEKEKAPPGSAPSNGRPGPSSASAGNGSSSTASATNDDIDRLIPSKAVAATQDIGAGEKNVISSPAGAAAAMQVVDLVDSDTSGQQQPMCAPLVTNSPPGRSSKSGKSPIIATTADVAIRRESVIVYYGIQELKVPLQFCRLFTVPDDQALEILHGSAYDTEKALAVVAQLLAVDKTTATTSTMGVPLEIVDSAARRKAGRPPLAQTVTTSEADAAINRCLISPTELDHLHGIVERYHNDLQKIHRKFNRYLAKQALRMKTINSEISSSDRAMGPYFFPNEDESPLIKTTHPQGTAWGPSTEAHPDFTGNGPTGAGSGTGAREGVRGAETGTAEYSVRTPQDIQRLFFVLYPGFDDENFSIMTAFNAPLFRQWNSPQSIAAAVKNYPFGNNKAVAQPPPLNKKGGGAAAPGKTAAVSSNAALTPQEVATSSNKKPSVGGGGNGFRIRKNPNLPNRWPKNLPLMQHNLYWIEMSSTPCLCTGLHIRGNSHDVQLNVISIHAESRRMQVAPNKVVPLYEDIMKSSTDERSVAFAAALMLFAEWELDTYVPLTSLLRKWYVYPEFVTQMLVTCSRYLSWRKQVDRNPRAATMSRRDNYLCSLKEDYLQISEAARCERFALSSLPWDDSPVSIGDDVDSSDDDEEDDDDDDTEGGVRGDIENRFGSGGSGGEEGEDDVDGIESIESYSDREQYERAEARRRSKNKRSRKREAGGSGSGAEDSDFLFTDQSLTHLNNGGSNKKRARKGNNSSNLDDLGEQPAGVKAPAVRSLYNMFWIPRSQLPCVYYDTPENRYADKFRVIPICCVTYHYPFYVSSATKGSVEPLRQEHLKLITDERTSEFTQALIEFARQENDIQRRAKLLAESMAAQQDSDTLLNGATGMEFEGTGTEDGNDSNSLMDASMLQPHELFDWPAFILELINKPSQWHSWRKKAERGGPGLKRYQYLRALHAQHRENEQQEALLKKQAAAAAAPAASTLTLKKDGFHLAGPPLVRSHYNLFWLLRSNLPAIYYDTPENRRGESFKVLPINCCQYQYPMKISKSAVIIEALSPGNLQHCTEDRTHDFTLALLDFAHWEQAERRKGSTGDGDGDGDLYFSSSPRGELEDTVVAAEHTWASSAEEDPNELYDWPAFILQMLNSPDKWSTWRKKAERSGGREPRRVLYFKALLEDYRAQMAIKEEGNAMDTTS